MTMQKKYFVSSSDYQPNQITSVMSLQRCTSCCWKILEDEYMSQINYEQVLIVSYTGTILVTY